MKIKTLFLLLAASFLITPPALAGNPEMRETALQYTTWSVWAAKPFEVEITAEADLCNSLVIVGDFIDLSSYQKSSPLGEKVWLAQFVGISTLMGCGKPGSRTVRSEKTLKLVPKESGESFYFVVPNSLKIEFKK